MLAKMDKRETLELFAKVEHVNVPSGRAELETPEIPALMGKWQLEELYG